MKDESPEVPQEDPIVMYLIIHTTLNMSVGKLAAQVGHAASLVTFNYSDLKDESRHIANSISYMKIQRSMNNSVDEEKFSKLEIEYSSLGRKLSIIGEWRKAGYRKVTLAANDKEWAKIKQDYPNDVMVVDAG